MGEIEEIRHSTHSMWSFGAIYLAANATSAIVIGRYIFFYENEILLPIWMMTLAIIFYTVWDMINDPLIGHISDRNYRFKKRWGKRFPWIIGSTIPIFIAIILVFTPQMSQF